MQFFKTHMNTKVVIFLCIFKEEVLLSGRGLLAHPVQVPKGSSNFAPRIKTKFKDFSEEI